MFAASAQAHTGTATTACSSATGNSVTFNWSAFATGTGNGGKNTPGWKIAYTPTGGATTTTTGNVSFPSSSYSLTVPIPGHAGTVVASSSWTSSQTTDGNASSFSKTLEVPNCLASTTIVTTASPGVAVGGTIKDQAVLSGGHSPTGTITFHLYAKSDTTCATALSTGTATVNGNGSYTSPTVTENTAGSYQWTATYSGDANNAAAADACGQPAEQVTVSKASPTIVTTGSPGVAAGGTIQDQAVLSGGNSPTGTITFHLYAKSDTTCATALSTGTATVNGNGSYASPTVTENTAGSYQWTATYSGDANNAAAADACNEAAEQVTVFTPPAGSAPPVGGTPPAGPTQAVLGVQAVRAACVASPVRLTGVIGKVRNSFTAHLTSQGVKSVTFYLDGRKLVTLTKPKNGRFSITINATRLAYGAHRLVAKATVSNRNCAGISRAGTFVRVKAAAVVPVFTG